MVQNGEGLGDASAMQGRSPDLGLAILILAAAAGPALAQESAREPQTVVVTAPLPDGQSDLANVPGEVETVTMSDFSRDRHDGIVSDAVARALSSVGIVDEAGSPFQPDFVYRGFEASPVSGAAEGLAVYQDGTRLNEAFGDNVDWDLVPEFAVARVTLESDNPAFGLNALGGAVSLEMTGGFDFAGVDAELSGGSYGDRAAHAEFGRRFGRLGAYLALGATDDDGFRADSPARLRQAYGDLAYEAGGLTLHLSATGALNVVAAAGPTPVELLARDRRAVFTEPQSQSDGAGLVQLRGSYDALGPTLSFNLYYRRFDQSLIDGNTTDVVPCSNNGGWLCLGGGDLFPTDALYATTGGAVAASALPAGAVPGEIDHTKTRSDSAGLALQSGFDRPLMDFANRLVIGGALDAGWTDYAARGVLGALGADLRVAPSAIVIDQALSPTAEPPLEAPVALGAQNLYGDLYAVDALTLAPALTLTLSGRLNTAAIRMEDRIGTSLDGRHAFARFDPGIGLDFRPADGVTLYGGYSEADRAPTPGELSCADPRAPCLLGAFLVSDPPLKEVVARDFEFGLRGHAAPAWLPGTFTWSLGAYRTDARRDILLVATAINGFGYFQNAGTTRHQGLDLHGDYRDEGWRVTLGYSYLDAEFRNAETIASNSPYADAQGFIHVRPGDRLPQNPAHRLTLSLERALTDDVRAGLDLKAQSASYLAGDDSNQAAKLPGYAVVGLHGDYALGSNLVLFASIENLLDRHYAVYGSFAALDNLPIALSDPRSESPAPGRLFYAGLRVAVP